MSIKLRHSSVIRTNTSKKKEFIMVIASTAVTKQNALYLVADSCVRMNLRAVIAVCNGTYLL